MITGLSPGLTHDWYPPMPQVEYVTLGSTATIESLTIDPSRSVSNREWLALLLDSGWQVVRSKE